MKRIEKVVIKRKQLDKAYDEKIQALYTVMENNLEQSEIEYAEKLKQELDKRAEAYQNNPSIAISAIESKNVFE